MRPLSIVVLGGGISGLAAALILGRDGHRVTLVERDPFVAGNASEAYAWERAGIPHFLQPHAFGPRGRTEMRAAFPDIFGALVTAGAWDVDLRPKIRGPGREDDEELAYFAARRPLIEWALRRAVLSESGIRAMSGIRATGYEGKSGTRPRVTAVQTTAGVIPADLVIDAMGRRTPSAEWIGALGGNGPTERSSDCGIIYYSRYYQLRPGARLPDGPWILGPRADLGYAMFSTFPGDNGTFAAVVGIPPGDRDLKLLRHAGAFEAAVATMPALYSWANPDTSTPITDVLPMGSLRNTLRTDVDGRSMTGNGASQGADGVIGVGDTVCHTDPALALGLTFGLVHASALAAAIRAAGPEVTEIAAAFEGATRPDMEQRFQVASEIDDARSRRWAGERVDIAHRDGGAYNLFALAAGAVAALDDGDVFRTVVRRNTLLDPLAVLDDDIAMQERIERLFADAMARGRPAPGPTRDDLVRILREAVVGS